MLLFRNAGVHAPEPLPSCDVLVIGERIAAVAPNLDPPRIPGMETTEIDAEGRYLIPGLVDALVHFSGGGGEAGFGSRTPPLDADRALENGLTTVIGCLGTDAVTRTHADLLATCRALVARGLNAWCLTGSYALPAPTLTGSIETDLVWIPEIIGIGEIALGDHRGSQPGVDSLAAALSESWRGAMLAGKRGTALLHLGDTPGSFELIEALLQRTALPRRQCFPTHCNRNDDLFEAALTFARAGGTIDLTTSTTPPLLEMGERPAARALADALDGGVAPTCITMSSDGQASLPEFSSDGRLHSTQVADTASLWAAVRSAVLEHAVPLQEAIASVTVNPAEAFGLSGQCGRIAPGLRGDLLLVEPDSLDIVMTVSDGAVRWCCPEWDDNEARRAPAATTP
jgi:beta-aspartyl-dipeptidase (metallo-type)